MKKWIILLVVLLVGCRQEQVRVVPIEAEKIVEEVEVEEIDYIESTLLDDIILESNIRCKTIELELLDERMQGTLKEKINPDQSLQEKEEIIEQVVQDALQVWKKEVISDVIEDLGVYVNEDDYLTIVGRVSVKDAYSIMYAYEVIIFTK